MIKSLKVNILLGGVLGVLLAQVACGGGNPPGTSDCTDAEGVNFPCPIDCVCNMCLDEVATPYQCIIPDDGQCCNAYTGA